MLLLTDENAHLRPPVHPQRIAGVIHELESLVGYLAQNPMREMQVKKIRRAVALILELEKETR